MIYLDAVANLSYQLGLHPALEAGKWAWKEIPEAPGQVGPKQNLGRNLKHNLENFQG
jgi:hypothetical protein